MELQQQFKVTYKYPMALVLFTPLFPVAIGILLRLPKFILEIMSRKPWTLDWVRLLAIGIPTLAVLVMWTLAFSGYGGGPVSKFLVVTQPTLTTIAGIALGYILLDSIKESA